ncbi:nucleoside monophosphate kinase [Candidatus Saccharibacteria bacterium]|nr:nucleoside monophosphate kinase [Candidatus Saccharibacteria bacterium]
MNDSLTLSEKLDSIKAWLGTGSINIFGLPMSGKDTVGVRLAEDLDAKFLSSGLIIRAMESANRERLTSSGELIPSDVFYEWILPYFEREELRDFPLILSSIGRWKGEEDRVLESAETSGHEIKAAVILNVSEADVEERWNVVRNSSAAAFERGSRSDDKDPVVFQKRIAEFRKKTLPVILKYKQLGLLVEVKADMDRETVYQELVDRLYAFIN